MTSDDDDDLARRRRSNALAEGLRAQAEAGGLRFDVYLPSDLATWLLDKIANGIFFDPSEAVFVMLGEQQDLEAQPDLRSEVFRRSVQAASDDPGPDTPVEEFFQEVEKELARPRPAPATWPPRRRLDRSSLTVGDTFRCGEGQWRCTDIGMRTITAIRTDHVDVSGPEGVKRSLTREEADADGWFNGPPYVVAEVVFDEHDQEECTIDIETSSGGAEGA